MFIIVSCFKSCRMTWIAWSCLHQSVGVSKPPCHFSLHHFCFWLLATFQCYPQWHTHRFSPAISIQALIKEVSLPGLIIFLARARVQLCRTWTWKLTHGHCWKMARILLLPQTIAAIWVVLMGTIPISRPVAGSRVLYGWGEQTLLTSAPLMRIAEVVQLFDNRTLAACQWLSHRSIHRALLSLACLHTWAQNKLKGVLY